MTEHLPFKQCPQCQAEWATLEDFVTDTDLHVQGYQASFDDPDNGIIVYTHRVPGCGTTLAVAAGRFKALYCGPLYLLRRTGSEDCKGLCLDEGRLEECEADCDLAWIRTALQALRRHELPECYSK